LNSHHCKMLHAEMIDECYCCCVQERSLQEENKALQKEVSCQIAYAEAMYYIDHRRA
jgi:hypothetical protein